VEILTAKPNAVGTLSTMSVLFFTEGEFSNWNTRFVHFQECSKYSSNNIPFEFKDSFKKLSQNLQASTDGTCPRSQTVRPKR